MAAELHLTAGLALFFLLGGPGALAQAPASAEDPQPKRIVENCSDRKEGELVVCGRRDPDSEYRLPPDDAPFDPWGDMESVSRERHRLMGPIVAATGTCSTMGPGGWTGCGAEAIKRAEQQGKRIGIGNGRPDLRLQVGRKSYRAPFP
jgi:hypothetical protein